MTVSLEQIIVWMLIGALVGNFVGRLITRRKKGYGLLGNLVLGLVGGLVGGFLFDLLEIVVFPGIEVSATDLVAAFVGSLVVLLVIYIIQSR